MPGRTLAIGDIHGCHIALEGLLDAMQPSAEDTVIVLGDVVDRGPGTRQAIDRLLELQDTSRLIFLLGNHEELMLDAVDGGRWTNGWLQFGGMETIESYDGAAEGLPEAHLEFLRSGYDYWEADTDIFVHATLEPGVPLEQQSDEWLRWAKVSGDEPPHPSGKRIICGHTSQKSGRPLVWDGWACIDTWAYGEGWLTGLDVATDAIWQTRQSGELREGLLTDFRQQS